jgi:hypothetical protein
VASEDPQVQAAQRQNLFREVNERIGELVPDGDELGELLCECIREDCTEVILLSRDEYEAVRLVPTRFLVLPDHETLELENTVETTERYVVVEKFGAAGQAAIRHDPRRRRRADARAAEA